MSEVELVLVNDTDKCTIYTIQFSEEAESEYERFYSKFIKDAHLNQDLLRSGSSAASIKASFILSASFRQNSCSRQWWSKEFAYIRRGRLIAWICPDAPEI